jgi:hypothetical protein
MYIFTKDQLKEAINFLHPKLNSILNSTLKKSSSKELIATLFGYNSYAHLSSEVRNRFVEIDHQNNLDPFKIILYNKHKITPTKEQERLCRSLYNEFTFDALYMPDFTFPADSDDFGTFGITQNTQLVELKSRIMSFRDYIQNGKNIPDDFYKEEIDENLYDSMPEEAIDWESEDIGKQTEDWIKNNPKDYKEVCSEIISNSGKDFFHELDGEGFLVEIKASSLNDISEYSPKFKEAVSKSGIIGEDVLITWSTLCSYSEDYKDGLEGPRGVVVMKKIYMAIKQKEKITPIGTACSRSIDIADHRSSNSLFEAMDMHSACMNDTYKAFMSRVNSKDGWEEYLENENHFNWDEGTTLHRLWTHSNTFNCPYLDAYMTWELSLEFSPFMSHSETGFHELMYLEESIGDFSFSNAHIIYLETCGSREPNEVVNPMMMFAGKKDENLRGEMTEDERDKFNKQVNFSSITKTLFEDFRSTTVVDTYDPFAYPFN